ncbi:MAG: bifunctional precorrin-2 dehydrogenase/sirohydrochlorin ferrochelatase, partial [Actinomycetota bacterium]|nr:bifunctional precorrin-2 dehydrogenase/sirohydrochlorin ferrochelatase [Actinomycetota bacterium]
MRFGYPVFLDLHGVPVLVVGAGAVGVRKIRGLVTAGANVHVVALDIDESLD